jgi:glycosyltransferase involved in cell wall biosynthesis
VSLKAVAAFAQQTLIDFISSGRSSEYLYFADFMADCIKRGCDNFPVDDSAFRKLDHLLQIFGASAFIKWKHVRDFDQDAMSIAESMIVPIRDFYFKSGLAKNAAQTPVSMGRIDYVSNFDPLNFQGVATCFSVYNLLDSFEDYLKTGADFKLRTFVRSVGVGAKLETVRHVCQSGNTIGIVRHDDFNAVIRSMRETSPEYIFLDYFIYPYNLIPFLFPSSKIVYFGFGFSLFLFPGVSAIVTQEKTPLISGFLEDRAPDLVERYICPPRIHSGTPNLDLRLPESSYVKSQIIDFRGRFDRLVGTLCRYGKISAGFIDAVEKILSDHHGVGFVIAGDGCPEILSKFNSRFAGRILALDRLPSFEILSVCDVYLETFPEHQGLAAVEAIKSGLPVVYLDSGDARHTLLSERSPLTRSPSVEQYTATVGRLLYSDPFRETVVLDQSRALAVRRMSGADYWNAVFAATKLDRRESHFK